MFLICIILTAHFIFDFVLQPERIALGKSKSTEILLTHIIQYTSGMFSTILIYLLIFSREYTIAYCILMALIFACCTFTAHFLTDYITSKASAAAYEQKKFRGIGGFWFWIGLDQLLHTLQLIICLRELDFINISPIFN